MDQNPLPERFLMAWPETREYDSIVSKYKPDNATKPVASLKPVASPSNQRLRRSTTRKEPSALLRALCPTRYTSSLEVTRPIFPPAPGPGPGTYAPTVLPPNTNVAIPRLSQALVLPSASSQQNRSVYNPNPAATLPNPTKTFISQSNMEPRTRSHPDNRDVKSLLHLPELGLASIHDANQKSAPSNATAFTRAARAPLHGVSEVTPGPGAYHPTETHTGGSGSGSAAPFVRDTRAAALAALHGLTSSGGSSTARSRLTSIALTVTRHIDEQQSDSTALGPGAYYRPGQAYFSMGAAGDRGGHARDRGAGPSQVVDRSHGFSRAPRDFQGAFHRPPEETDQVKSKGAVPFESLLLGRAERLKKHCEAQAAASASPAAVTTPRRSSRDETPVQTPKPSVLGSPDADGDAGLPQHRSSAPVRSIADVEQLYDAAPGYTRAQLAAHMRAVEEANAQLRSNGAEDEPAAEAGSAVRVRGQLGQAKPRARKQLIAERSKARDARIARAQAMKTLIEGAERVRVERDAHGAGLGSGAGSSVHTEGMACAGAWAIAIKVTHFLTVLRRRHEMHLLADEEHERRLRAARIIQKCVRTWLETRQLHREARAGAIILRMLRLNVLRQRARRRRWAAHVLVSALVAGAQKTEMVARVQRVRNAAVKLQRWWRRCREARKWALYGPHLQWEREMTHAHTLFKESEGTKAFNRLKKRGLLKNQTALNANAKENCVANVFVPQVGKDVRHRLLVQHYQRQRLQWHQVVREYLHRDRVWLALFHVRKQALEAKTHAEEEEHSGLLREQRALEASADGMPSPRRFPRSPRRMAEVDHSAATQSGDEWLTQPSPSPYGARAHALARASSVSAEMPPKELYEIVKDLPPRPERPYLRVFLPKAVLYALFLDAYELVTPAPPASFRSRVKVFLGNQLRRMVMINALNGSAPGMGMRAKAQPIAQTEVPNSQ